MFSHMCGRKVHLARLGGRHDGTLPPHPTPLPAHVDRPVSAIQSAIGALSDRLPGSLLVIISPAVVSSR